MIKSNIWNIPNHYLYQLSFFLRTRLLTPWYLGNNFVSDGHICNTFCPMLLKLVDVWLKTLWAGLDKHMGYLFPIEYFHICFPTFSDIFILGSVSDGHFAEHWKWLLWLLWNYCQTIQISRKTTIDDLFLYQLPITRYLQISWLFNCSIVIPLRQKSTFVHH